MRTIDIVLATFPALLATICLVACTKSPASMAHRPSKPIFVVLWLSDLQQLMSDKSEPVVYGIIRQTEAGREGDVLARTMDQSALYEQTFRSRRELQVLLKEDRFRNVDLKYYKVSYRSTWTIEPSLIPKGDDTMIDGNVIKTDSKPIGSPSAGLSNVIAARLLPAMPDGRLFVVTMIAERGMSAPIEWPTDMWTSAFLVHPDELWRELKAGGVSFVVQADQIEDGAWKRLSNSEASRVGIKELRDWSN